MAESRDSKVCYSFYSFKPGDEFERSNFTDVRKKHQFEAEGGRKGGPMKRDIIGCGRVGSVREACRGAF